MGINLERFGFLLRIQERELNWANIWVHAWGKETDLTRNTSHCLKLVHYFLVSTVLELAI